MKNRKPLYPLLGVLGTLAMLSLAPQALAFRPLYTVTPDSAKKQKLPIEFTVSTGELVTVVYSVKVEGAFENLDSINLYCFDKDNKALVMSVPLVQLPVTMDKSARLQRAEPLPLGGLKLSRAFQLSKEIAMRCRLDFNCDIGGGPHGGKIYGFKLKDWIGKTTVQKKADGQAGQKGKVDKQDDKKQGDAADAKKGAANTNVETEFRAREEIAGFMEDFLHLAMIRKDKLTLKAGNRLLAAATDDELVWLRFNRRRGWPEKPILERATFSNPARDDILARLEKRLAETAASKAKRGEFRYDRATQAEKIEQAKRAKQAKQAEQGAKQDKESPVAFAQIRGVDKLSVRPVVSELWDHFRFLVYYTQPDAALKCGEQLLKTATDAEMRNFSRRASADMLSKTNRGNDWKQLQGVAERIHKKVSGEAK